MFLELIDAGVIDTNREYYWRRTDGWDWFGEHCWWNIFVTFANGMHGGGGACITEHWRWNNSSQTIRREYRNLTLIETRDLVQQLHESGQIEWPDKINN